MTALPKPKGRIAAALDSDLAASFLASKSAVAAGVITLLFLFIALFAPLIAPYNPFDPAQVFLLDARDPPIWMAGADPKFLLGTDDQGRDMLSAIFYGLRVSLLIGGLGVILSAAIGITLGLIAGYVGGRIDALIMRIADIQLTFPAILIALLVDGVVHAVLKGGNREDTAFRCDGAGDRAVLLGAICANRQRIDAGRTEQGLCPRSAAHRPSVWCDTLAARASERAWSSAGHRNDQSRARCHH